MQAWPAPSAGSLGGASPSVRFSQATEANVDSSDILQASCNIADLLAPCKHYVATGVVGQGAFGVVLRGIDVRQPYPTELAFKLLPRGDFMRHYKTYVKREIIHQSMLKHPLIVGVREVFLTPTHLGIAMEFAQGGDLQKHLARSPGGHVGEDEARWLFQQCIIALDYCHRRGIANRDLKLENLLLETHATVRPLLKICDFGYSKHELNSSAKTGVGTATYMAPEVIMGDGKYDAKKADVWSLGVVLFALLFGVFPFNAADDGFVRKLVTAQYTLPAEISVSNMCQELLSRLLAPDPQQRPSVEQVMQHPWFQCNLPEGACELNDLLLQQVVGLEESHYRVDKLVDQAVELGFPGEPVTAVEF